MDSNKRMKQSGSAEQDRSKRVEGWRLHAPAIALVPSGNRQPASSGQSHWLGPGWKCSGSGHTYVVLMPQSQRWYTLQSAGSGTKPVPVQLVALRSTVTARPGKAVEDGGAEVPVVAGALVGSSGVVDG